jgi:membrane protease YdiL (CAAX protease family)
MLGPLKPLSAPERRELRRALAWAGGLALYGNLLNLLVLLVPPARRGLLGTAGPLVLTGAVLAWHRLVERGPLPDLGLHRRRWRGDLLWGGLAGLLMAVPPVLFFRPPGKRHERVRFAEVEGIGYRAFLRRLLVTTPVLVAFAEELAFRGFLQGRLRRALPGRPGLAVAVSSLAFALWHVAVNVRTLRATNVLSAGLTPLPVALAAGLLAVFGGGLVFGALYSRAGSLVGPVAAHWLVDAVMLLALVAQRKATERAGGRPSGHPSGDPTAPGIPRAGA